MSEDELRYGFSPQRVIDTVGADYLHEIMKEYINTVNRLQLFSLPCAKAQHADLVRCLHSIKSASFMVGALECGQWAATLEQQARYMFDDRMSDSTPCGSSPYAPQSDCSQVACSQVEWPQELERYQQCLSTNVAKINGYLRQDHCAWPPEG